MYVITPFGRWYAFAVSLTYIIAPDQARNEIMMQCTPALAPKLKAVLGPPNEQLRDGTRAELMSLVEALQMG